MQLIQKHIVYLGDHKPLHVVTCRALVQQTTGQPDAKSTGKGESKIVVWKEITNVQVGGPMSIVHQNIP